VVAFSTKLKLDLFTAKEQKRLAFSVPLLEAPRIIDFFFDYFFLAREEKKSYCLRPRRTSALHRCPATAVSSSGYIFSLCLLTTLPFW